MDNPYNRNTLREVDPLLFLAGYSGKHKKEGLHRILPAVMSTGYHLGERCNMSPQCMRADNIFLGQIPLVDTMDTGHIMVYMN